MAKETSPAEAAGDALRHFFNRDCTVLESKIVMQFASHADAIQSLRRARRASMDALAFVRTLTDQEVTDLCPIVDPDAAELAAFEKGIRLVETLLRTREVLIAGGTGVPMEPPPLNDELPERIEQLQKSLTPCPMDSGFSKPADGRSLVSHFAPVLYREDNGQWRVRCWACSCTVYGHTPDDAVERWNRRTS